MFDTTIFGIGLNNGPQSNLDDHLNSWLSFEFTGANTSKMKKREVGNRPLSGNRLLRWLQKLSGARSVRISLCTVPGFCGVTRRRVFFFRGLKMLKREVHGHQLTIYLYHLYNYVYIYTLHVSDVLRISLGSNSGKLASCLGSADLRGIEYNWRSPSLQPSTNPLISIGPWNPVFLGHYWTP